MKEANPGLSLLFDFYSPLLTEKQCECFDLYYNQDYSLSEIAENCGISRQGVHDTLSRTETTLVELEQQLGCAAREKRIQLAAERLTALADGVKQGTAASAESIRSVVDLLEKE